jgi:hypothetical protein
MFEKIKQLKNLRDQAKRMQDELAQITVNAEGMAGKISVVMDGNQKIMAIDISTELLDTSKKEVLEKAIAETVNEAVKKAQIEAARKMQGMGGLSGMNIPGL